MSLCAHNVAVESIFSDEVRTVCLLRTSDLDYQFLIHLRTTRDR